jgi:hypothetical protein
LILPRKRVRLEAVDPRRAQALSAWAFSAFGQAIRAACLRAGVEVIAVNPARMSVIARSISPRGSVFQYTSRWRLPSRDEVCPSARRVVATPIRGGHVTLPLPERNRRKHVWSFWAEVASARKAARASAFPVVTADGHLRGAYQTQRDEAKSFGRDRLLLPGGTRLKYLALIARKAVRRRHGINAHGFRTLRCRRRMVPRDGERGLRRLQLTIHRPFGAHPISEGRPPDDVRKMLVSNVLDRNQNARKSPAVRLPWRSCATMLANGSAKADWPAQMLGGPRGSP